MAIRIKCPYKSGSHSYTENVCWYENGETSGMWGRGNGNTDLCSECAVLWGKYRIEMAAVRHNLGGLKIIFLGVHITKGVLRKTD
jgi:hypothetical protein